MISRGYERCRLFPDNNFFNQVYICSSFHWEIQRRKSDKVKKNTKISLSGLKVLFFKQVLTFSRQFYDY